MKSAQVLAVEIRISTAAAITETDVQKAVGPEGEIAPVVVLARLVHLEQDLRRGRVCNIGVAGRHLVARHHRVGVAGRRSGRTGRRVGLELRVADEEVPVGGVVRMKRESEKPLLVAGVLDQRTDIQERCEEHSAVLEDENAAGLLGNEEATGPVARVRDRQRPCEACRH